MEKQRTEIGHGIRAVVVADSRFLGELAYDEPIALEGVMQRFRKPTGCVRIRAYGALPAAFIGEQEIIGQIKNRFLRRISDKHLPGCDRLQCGEGGVVC